MNIQRSNNVPLFAYLGLRQSNPQAAMREHTRRVVHLKTAY
jgi:hypothetical protein